MDIAKAVGAVTQPGVTGDRLVALDAALTAQLPQSDVTTLLRLAHFLAQASHESAGWSAMVENLNYSADGLRKTWPTRFNPVNSAAYARQPEKIANKVYADRMGNGHEASGDGWRYRGRGIFQLTGRANYRASGARIGVDLEAEPDRAAEPFYAVAIALAYWAGKGLSALADRDDVAAITRKINGGQIGLDDRKARLAKAKRALGIG